MALRTWTVREALQGASDRLTRLTTDARLTPAQQGTVGTLLTAVTAGLSALRADNTIPVGQRNSLARGLTDNIRLVAVIQEAMELAATVSIDEFYNALDLAWDAATAMIAGQPTFVSDLGPGL